MRISKNAPLVFYGSLIKVLTKREKTQFLGTSFETFVCVFQANEQTKMAVSVPKAFLSSMYLGDYIQFIFHCNCNREGTENTLFMQKMRNETRYIGWRDVHQIKVYYDRVQRKKEKDKKYNPHRVSKYKI